MTIRKVKTGEKQLTLIYHDSDTPFIDKLNEKIDDYNHKKRELVFGD